MTKQTFDIEAERQSLRNNKYLRNRDRILTPLIK